MQLDESKFKNTHGYQEGKDVLDRVSLSKAAEYKKNVLKNFISINQTQITTRFKGDLYYVTRKYDGEYAIIFYENGNTVTVNRSGRTRRGIPCIEEAGKILSDAGIKQGIFPAEIYVYADYKTRVNDLIHALAHEEQIGMLKLAVFDILEIDGKSYKKNTYQQTWIKLKEIFGEGCLCHSVDMEVARSGNEITKIWENWVEKEGSEGLVVHSKSPVIFKIKPRMFLDAVVIAYGEGSGRETEQVRRMLFAVIPKSGYYQVLSRVGSGLNEKLRKELFAFFRGKQRTNPFSGIETKWEDLTFVTPELVIEVAVEEIVTEMSSGEKTNYLLSYDSAGYHIDGIVPGFRTYTPVFIRLREDKSADENDAGVNQVERFLNRVSENIRARNQIMIKDVLVKEEDKNIYIIWEDFNKRFVFYKATLQDRKCSRELFRSENFFELLDIYQKGVVKDYKHGFKRENSQTIITDQFHEIMQRGPGEW